MLGIPYRTLYSRTLFARRGLNLERPNSELKQRAEKRDKNDKLMSDFLQIPQKNVCACDFLEKLFGKSQRSISTG